MGAVWGWNDHCGDGVGMRTEFQDVVGQGGNGTTITRTDGNGGQECRK